MQSRYQQQLDNLHRGLFLLKLLCLRIDMYKAYGGEYHKYRLIETLHEWQQHYPTIRDIKLRWWEFGLKRHLINEIKIYKQSTDSYIYKLQKYNLL